MDSTSPLRVMRIATPLLLCMLALGCTSGVRSPDLGSEGLAREASAMPLRPAAIHHLVFVGLIDPDDASAIIDDSDAMLGTIPSVTYYFCGPHHDTGRDTIDRDYDIALGVGFENDEGYRVYLDHPDHLEFVNRWRPRAKWIRIHDVRDALR